MGEHRMESCLQKGAQWLNEICASVNAQSMKHHEGILQVEPLHTPDKLIGTWPGWLTTRFNTLEGRTQEEVLEGCGHLAVAKVNGRFKFIQFRAGETEKDCKHRYLKTLPGLEGEARLVPFHGWAFCLVGFAKKGWVYNLQTLSWYEQQGRISLSVFKSNPNMVKLRFGGLQIDRGWEPGQRGFTCPGVAGELIAMVEATGQ